MRQALAAAAFVACAALGAQPAPPLAGARLAGEGSLRFLGLEMYSARLWVAAGFQPADYAARPLALELLYRRGFDASAIARRSIQEMRRVGSFSDGQAARWQEALQAALPDVQDGDRLTGLLRPGAGVVFQLHGRTTGEIADPEFARLFFGIWLSPATSEPQLRAALLGGQPGSPP